MLPDFFCNFFYLIHFGFIVRVRARTLTTVKIAPFVLLWLVKRAPKICHFASEFPRGLLKASKTGHFCSCKASVLLWLVKSTKNWSLTTVKSFSNCFLMACQKTKDRAPKMCHFASEFSRRQLKSTKNAFTFSILTRIQLLLDMKANISGFDCVLHILKLVKTKY